MSFKNIRWKTGDLVDVTRMNQHVANDQYLYDLFSKMVLYADSKYYTETIGSNLNQIYLKVDSTQIGGIASAETSLQQYYVPNTIANASMAGLTDGVEYDLYLNQGHDNYLTSFIKSPAMNYLTYWVTVTRKDGIWGHLNLIVMTSTEELSV